MKRSLLLLVIIATTIIRAFGQGAYIEFKMTTQKNNMSGTVKTYYLDGNNRSEITMQAPTGAMNIVTISKKDVPDTVYMLTEKNKTYTAMASNKGKANQDEDYEITVLGKENVNGYNSTHVKILYKKSNKTSEMWTSKDVVDYAFFKSVKNKYLDGSKLFEALTAKGADGFPVRIVVNEGNTGQGQLDLVKAEKQKVDPALFSLNGYTRTAGFNPQEMREKMQSMTPEEKQQYLQQLKEQYIQQQQPPH